MKNKIFLLILILSMVLITGCDNKKDNKKEYSKEALAFKKDYESLNGKKNKNGKKHRSVSISKDNPFEKINASDVLAKMENKETFYLYFGDKQCPWCRSVIEKAIEMANKKKIKKIYYVSIWDDEGNEILRDTYKLGKKNKPIKVFEGSEEYKKLLEKLSGVLLDYTLTDSEGKDVVVGEKRIYAPNFIYIKDGNAVKLTEGISDKQEDAREKLTEEMLVDEEYLFDDFFTN
ncbi:MAG: hypothetical protein E7158_01275 [Firmicutes bacterium]|nr:hypothetical protein [Bacillota bacterium]